MHTQYNPSPAQSVAQVVSLLLSDDEVADILDLTMGWVRSHAGEIPGFERLGTYYRFRRNLVENWLGGSLEPLYGVERVSLLMNVKASWVYANADDIPGVLRLGHYLRFRPAVLHSFLQGSPVVQ